MGYDNRFMDSEHAFDSKTVVFNGKTIAYVNNDNHWHKCINQTTCPAYSSLRATYTKYDAPKHEKKYFHKRFTLKRKHINTFKTLIYGSLPNCSSQKPNCEA